MDERTPLISSPSGRTTGPQPETVRNEVVDEYNAHSSNHGQTLFELAKIMLISLPSTPDIGNLDIPVALYTLHLLSVQSFYNEDDEMVASPHEEVRGMNGVGRRRNLARLAVRSVERQKRCREALCNAIEAALDEGGVSTVVKSEDQLRVGDIEYAESTIRAEAVGNVEDMVGKEEAEVWLFKHRQLFPNSNITLAGVDLLLPSGSLFHLERFTSTNSRSQRRFSRRVGSEVWSRGTGQWSFLSHPVIRHVLEEVWCHGHENGRERSFNSSGDEEMARWSGREFLESIVTPARQHALHLISASVIFGLTITLCIQPGKWMTPYAPPDPHTDPESFHSISSKTVEIVWAIWVVSCLFNSLRSAMTLILHIPLLLALCLIPLSPTLSFTSLLFSIPSQTASFVSPLYPSLPLLFPKPLLPLSVLLGDMFTRGTASAALLVPPTIILFIIFAWSMNGDIFRLLFTLPSDPKITSSLSFTAFQPLARIASWISDVDPDPEMLIAPFSTRIALFVTLSTLIFFSLGITVARALSSPLLVTPSAVPRWAGGVRVEDEWETEYGLDIARQARIRFAAAVRDGARRSALNMEGGMGMGKIMVVAPLNLLVIPLDVAIVALRHNRNTIGILTALMVVRVRQIIALFLMALLCWPLVACERLFSSLS